MVKRLSNVDQNSRTLINVPTPTNGGDAVNKTYADLKVDLTTSQTITGPKIFDVGAFIDKGNQVYDVRASGVVIDGKKLTDAVTTAGSTTVTSTVGGFVSGDVGKRISLKDAASRATVSTGSITNGSAVLTATGFSRIDQGKPIKVVGAGAAGADLVTTILTYTSATQVTLATTASTTVSSASVTYGAKALVGTISTFNSSTSIVVSSAPAWSATTTLYYGTNNGTNLQAAATAAAGMSMYIPKGICLTNASISFTASNSKIIGAGVGKTVVVGSAESMNVLTINASGKQLENIDIVGIEIDTNNALEALPIRLDAGASATSDYIKNINITDCKFTNVQSVSNASLYVAMGLSNSKGYINKLNVKNCDFGAASGYHIYINGSDLTEFTLDRNYFHDAQFGSVKFDGTGGYTRSYKDWNITYNRWYNNSLALLDGQSLFVDLGRVGVERINISHNWFIEDNYVFRSQNFALQIHSGLGMKIENNYFWKINMAMAIGASNNGNTLQVDPDFMVHINRNFFYKCRGIVDHDASVYAIWDGNISHESGSMGMFSRHAPTKFINNYIYNAPVEFEVYDASDFTFSGFNLNTTGVTFDDNTIVDDRLLPDPSNAPTLSQVSGGALSARTYDVSYTWVNDTGETIVSTQASLSVSANNLLKVTLPYTTTYGIPTGAKKVNVYVSPTSGGTKTLQDWIAVSWQSESQSDIGGRTIFESGAPTWTEPTTGLITGASLPTANTTHPLTIFGLYEIISTAQFANNTYTNNKFYGIPVPIRGKSDVKRTSIGNLASGYLQNTTTAIGSMTSSSTTLTASTSVFVSGDVGKTIIVVGAGTNGAPLYTTIASYTSGTVVTLTRAAATTATSQTILFGTNSTISTSSTAILEAIPYNQGNVTGATTFDVVNGETIAATLTGNITVTLSNGHYVGQSLTLRLTQDATGSRTATWPGGFKKNNGVLNLSATASSLDVIKMIWDGTNWIESSRMLAVVASGNSFVTVGDVNADYTTVSSAFAANRRILVKNGTYNLSSALNPTVSNWTLEGESRDGTVLKVNNSTNVSVFNVTTEGLSGITIKNLTIDGNGANQSSAGGGFTAAKISDLTFENVRFKKSYNFNMLINSGTGTALTGTLTFTSGDDTVTGSSTLFTTELSVGSILKTAGGNFVRVASITSNTSLQLDRQFEYTTESAIAATSYVGNLRVKLINCIFEGSLHTDNVGLGLLVDGTIENCDSRSSGGGYGYGPDHCWDTAFINCIGAYNDNDGIGMETCAHCTVIGGSFFGSVSGNGIRLLSGSYRNKIIGAELYNNVNGINVTYNSTSFGKPDENSIFDCSVYSNSGHGIRLGGSARSVVRDNRVFNNVTSGIVTATDTSVTADNNDISSNRCYDTQDTKTQVRGIWISSGTGNRLTNNDSLTANHVTAGVTDAGTSTVIINTNGTTNALGKTQLGIPSGAVDESLVIAYATVL